MIAIRKLVAIFSIAALLLSNVAGWVHIGCVHSADSCCTTQAAQLPVSAQLSFSAQLPEVQGTGHSSCGCGHHHHHHSSTGSSEPAQASESTDAADELPIHGDDHDHDRCSICQSFFASRTCVVIADCVQVAELVVCEVNALPIDSVHEFQSAYDSISVRGPPSRV